MPGLVGAVTVTALAIGSMLTSVSPSSYFGSSRPWGYIAANVCFLPGSILSTVFDHNPINAANGSLWTLPVEVRAYMLLALLGALAIVRRPVIALLAVFGIAVCATASPSPSMKLLCMFAAGSALYLLREHVVIRTDVALCLLAAWLALVTTRWGTPAGLVAIPYITLWIAYLSPRRLRTLTKHGDVSYGVYLYAFPVQQTIVATIGVVSPPILILLAAPISWALGFASWHVIERPMLRLKSRGLRARAVAPAQVAPSIELAAD
jgi:peptidoglycan/LPS O-acetylase OafA/YrhL